MMLLGRCCHCFCPFLWFLSSCAARQAGLGVTHWAPCPRRCGVMPVAPCLRRHMGSLSWTSDLEFGCFLFRRPDWAARPRPPVQAQTSRISRGRWRVMRHCAEASDMRSLHCPGALNPNFLPRPRALSAANCRAVHPGGGLDWAEKCSYGGLQAMVALLMQGHMRAI